MIDHEHVDAAFARFEDFLRVGTAESRDQEEANAKGEALWESFGLSEEVRAHMYEHAVQYLGPYTCPQSLLFGALFALMAADAAGTLPTGERDWDADFSRLLKGEL